MREDQHAERAGGLDEPGCGDRLAGRGRVAEAVAANRTGIVRGGGLLVLELLDLVGRELELVLVLVLDGLLDQAVSVQVALRLGLDCRDQLGQHARERIDLMAAELGTGRELGRALAEHALEAEHQRKADLPLVGRLVATGFDLRECLVERTPPCRSRRKHDHRVFFTVQEGFARPGFRPGSIGREAVNRLRR